MWQPIELPYDSLPGLSRALLSAHYDLYLSYISRLNALRYQEEKIPEDAFFEYGRLKAEEGFLRNAIRLHELYFENLTPGGSGDPFESIGDDEMYARWERQFKMLCLASTGWVIHADDLLTGRRFNFTMREHGQGFVAGALPLVVVDCYEHAYMIDYGTSKQDYVEAVLENIDWDVVRARSEAAVAFASGGMR